ncbi:hypothetical protein ACUN24_00920 [Pedobacter sp. WC2501]|uniref:hypothetical protein n=1 Tax=Pedobacter sp. WC2501 TaxID=3461400 RepID=UPI0040458D50
MRKVTQNQRRKQLNKVKLSNLTFHKLNWLEYLTIDLSVWFLFFPKPYEILFTVLLCMPVIGLALNGLTGRPSIASLVEMLNLVTIETIQHYATIDTSIKNEGMESKVELKVLIEPSSNKHELNENIYELILTHVSNYQINFLNENNRTFEFDTDEVKLERDSKFEDKYILSFINASVDLHIKFSGLAIKLPTGNAKK